MQSLVGRDLILFQHSVCTSYDFSIHENGSPITRISLLSPIAAETAVVQLMVKVWCFLVLRPGIFMGKQDKLIVGISLAFVGFGSTIVHGVAKA